MSFPLLPCSHLTRYKASLYLKTNLPVCLFTHSNGIKIGPSYQKLRGVSKSTRAVKHPVQCGSGMQTNSYLQRAACFIAEEAATNLERTGIVVSSFSFGCHQSLDSPFASFCQFSNDELFDVFRFASALGSKCTCRTCSLFLLPRVYGLGTNEESLHKTIVEL